MTEHDANPPKNILGIPHIAWGVDVSGVDPDTLLVRACRYQGVALVWHVHTVRTTSVMCAAQRDTQGLAVQTLRAVNVARDKRQRVA